MKTGSKRGTYRGRDGALYTRSGLEGFVEGGAWSADDRILAFCTQASGGVAALIYHGKQPQSANAFLLRLPAGALRLALLVEGDGQQEIIPHRFQRVSILPYGWENDFRHRGLSIHSSLCALGSSLVWQVQVTNRRAAAVSITSFLILDREALATRVNGLRTWKDPEPWLGGLRLTAHDQLQTRAWIDTPGFKDTFIDAETILLLASNAPAETLSLCARHCEALRSNLSADSRRDCFVAKPPRNDTMVRSSNAPAETLSHCACHCEALRSNLSADPRRDCFVAKPPRNDSTVHSTSDPKSIEDHILALSGEIIPAGAQGRVNPFFILCGSSEEVVRSNLDRLQAAPGEPGREQSLRYAARAASHPSITLDGFPFAAAVFNLAPLYSEAVKVAQTGALRSSAGGYYFVWGWDSLMGGHELTRWGDPQAARQLLDFIAAHRAPDGSIPHRFDNDLQPLQVTGFGFTSLLFISLLYQYYSETLDRETLDRAYPAARQIFAALAARCDARGFYPCLGMYPDAPLKLGRTPQSDVSYELGFWYCACRMMEILANIEGEGGLAASAARLTQCLEASYLKAFFDPAQGFIVDCISGEAGESNGTYPRYALFPLHNAFGAGLLRPVIQDLSQFIQHELFKPDGIRMVPAWDPHAGTETVTGDCWFLHFDLYCLKAFRRAGDGAAIERWLRLAQSYFSECGVIPELQMLAPDGETGGGWRGITGQIWQLFAMSGWTRGLLEGVLGLETDIGGLTYIPCTLSFPIQMRQFPFRGGTWTVDIRGEGAWVGHLAVDGQVLQGTLKVPGTFYTPGEHQIEIVRTLLAPAAPCLMEAAGAGVLESKLQARRLAIRLQTFGQVNLVFYSPFPPQVMVNTTAVQADWNAESSMGTVEIPPQGIKDLLIDLLQVP